MRHAIWLQETRNYALLYVKNLKFLFYMGLVWYRDVTPGRTGRHTDGQNYNIVRA